MCNFYQRTKKKQLRSLSKGDEQSHSIWLISAHLLSSLWYFALFNEVPHLIAILFLNWVQILMPLLASVLGRNKTNVATVRLFRFLSRSQEFLSRMCDKRAEKYIFPKNVQTFQAIPYHRWQREKLIQIIPVLTIQLKLSSWLVSATYGSWRIVLEELFCYQIRNVSELEGN